jgi:hypothetical protein
MFSTPFLRVTVELGQEVHDPCKATYGGAQEREKFEALRGK